MIRSILAVLAGFFLIPILSLSTDAAIAAVAPDWYPAGGRVDALPALLLSCVYVAAFGILGCYVTARLAPSRPMLHALILGVMGLALTIPMTMLAWDALPAWYNVYNLLAVMPYAWIGGRIRERQLAASPESGRLAHA